MNFCPAYKAGVRDVLEKLPGIGILRRDNSLPPDPLPHLSAREAQISQWAGMTGVRGCEIMDGFRILSPLQKELAMAETPLPYQTRVLGLVAVLPSSARGQ